MTPSCWGFPAHPHLLTPCDGERSAHPLHTLQGYTTHHLSSPSSLYMGAGSTGGPAQPLHLSFPTHLHPSRWTMHKRYAPLPPFLPVATAHTNSEHRTPPCFCLQDWFAHKQGMRNGGEGCKEQGCKGSSGRRDSVAQEAVNVCPYDVYSASLVQNIVVIKGIPQKPSFCGTTTLKICAIFMIM